MYENQKDYNLNVLSYLISKVSYRYWPMQKK